MDVQTRAAMHVGVRDRGAKPVAPGPSLKTSSLERATPDATSDALHLKPGEANRCHVTKERGRRVVLMVQHGIFSTKKLCTHERCGLILDPRPHAMQKQPRNKQNPMPPPLPGHHTHRLLTHNPCLQGKLGSGAPLLALLGTAAGAGRGAPGGGALGAGAASGGRRRGGRGGR